VKTRKKPCSSWSFSVLGSTGSSQVSAQLPHNGRDERDFAGTVRVGGGIAPWAAGRSVPAGVPPAAATLTASSPERWRDQQRPSSSLPAREPATGAVSAPELLKPSPSKYIIWAPLGPRFSLPARLPTDCATPALWGHKDHQTLLEMEWGHAQILLHFDQGGVGRLC